MRNKTASYIAAVKKTRREKQRMLETEGIFGYLRSSKGFVLIIVLLVSAMLITVSGEFFINAQTNISYMSSFKNETQALELARAGIAVSVFILEADKTGRAGSILPGVNTNASIDSYNDIWAIQMPELPVEDGGVSVTIRDEQSKINLSILATEFLETRYYSIAKRVFLNMGFTMDIVDCIRDWVDPDQNKSAYGAETFDYYSTLPKPYTAKNAPLDSIDELLMIKGITPKIFYGLGGGNTSLERNLVDDNMFIKPFSLDPAKNTDKTDNDEVKKIGREKNRALSLYFRANGGPDDNNALNKININTAPYRVLSALTDKITDDTVTALIRKRPFTSVEEAMSLIGDDTIKEKLTVSSGLFSITAEGRFRGRKVTVYAVYNRNDKQYYYYGIQ